MRTIEQGARMNEQQHVCGKCGVLVADKKRHRKWHRRLQERMSRQAVELQRRTDPRLMGGY